MIRFTNRASETEARIGLAMQAVKGKVSVGAELIERMPATHHSQFVGASDGGRVDPKHFPHLGCGALW